jgi:hypothetical protein
MSEESKPLTVDEVKECREAFDAWYTKEGWTPMLKLEVGQTVWVRKTGNAVYHLRWKETAPDDYIVEAQVVTVGRKWFTIDKQFSSERFSLETGGNDGHGYASSYYVYLTKQEILNEFEKNKLCLIVGRNDGWPRRLTLDQLRRIKAIIEEGPILDTIADAIHAAMPSQDEKDRRIAELESNIARAIEYARRLRSHSGICRSMLEILEAKDE